MGNRVPMLILMCATAGVLWGLSVLAWAQASVHMPTWTIGDISQVTLNRAIYVGVVLIGLLLHYGNERLKGKTGSDTFWDYWLRDEPGSSMATIVVVLIGIGTVLQSTMLDPMSPWAVFIMALQNGYMTNSLVNGGAVTTSPAPAQPGGTQQ